jgi:hypothetical protein
MNSHNFHERFIKDSGKEFYCYHKLYEKNWSTFKEKDRPLSIIYYVVLEALNASKRQLVVADIGSGTGGLKNIIGNHKHLKQLKGFDHVSVDLSWIEARDMSNTDL